MKRIFLLALAPVCALHGAGESGTKMVCCNKAERTQYAVKLDGGYIRKDANLYKDLKDVAEVATKRICALSVDRYKLKFDFTSPSGSITGKEVTWEECCNGKVEKMTDWENANATINLGSGSIDIAYDVSGGTSLHPWCATISGFAAVTTTPVKTQLIYRGGCTPSGSASATTTVGYTDVPVDASVGVQVTATAGYRFANAETYVWTAMVFKTTARYTVEARWGYDPVIYGGSLQDSSLYLDVGAGVESRTIYGTWLRWTGSTTIRLI